MKKNIVFLPCRKGSERVPHKNTRIFAGVEGGLLGIKLNELSKAQLIDEIIVSSNDDEVLRIATSLQSDKISTIRRNDSLCSSQTSTDQLIKYVAELIKDGTVMWTHVTSPFLKAETYDDMLRTYYEHYPTYDSLMAVNPIRTFLWNNKQPVNYQRNQEKWPRTQTIDPLFEVNSGAFIADASIYHTLNDRVGKHVYMYETSKLESMDIDWQEDFDLAEKLYKMINIL
ncbi:MAG: acylneuraminate cytidylyltransferase family protein [Paludibacteraceae bacterium]|nr:acylneuraminate cytidylyltransferase family protein [Paludibacteraceae bacterium]